MNETVNTFLLARDKFVPEMHLHISLVVHSLKIKISKETGDSRYIYQNELNRTCFQHDMAYGDSKDLNRRTAVDKVLCDKVFYIAKNPKMMDVNVELLQWFINFLIKNYRWNN